MIRARIHFLKEMLEAGVRQQTEDPASYLYKVMAETLSGADYIFEQSKLRPSGTAYPNSGNRKKSENDRLPDFV